MPEKPPGMEDWTWEEIAAGRKMTAEEKAAREQERALRMMRRFGVIVDQDGQPQIRTLPRYIFILMGLVALLAFGLWLAGLIEFEPVK